MRPGREIPVSTPTRHPSAHEHPALLVVVGLVLVLACALRGVYRLDPTAGGTS